MEKKDLGNLVLNVLELRSKMKSDKFAFESGVETIRRLSKLGDSLPMSVVDKVYERFMESYVDYNKAYRTLPTETQKLVEHDEFQPYYRMNLKLD